MNATPAANSLKMTMTITITSKPVNQEETTTQCIKCLDKLHPDDIHGCGRCDYCCACDDEEDDEPHTDDRCMECGHYFVGLDNGECPNCD